jgi:hypothetical protein
MYSVVVISATLPVQPLPALMPNRLNDGVPSAWLISLRPQPVSWPAWPEHELPPGCRWPGSTPPPAC